MTPPVSSTAHIAFGGNVGDVKDNLRRALTAVARLPQTRLVRVSSLYRTAPVGVLDQPPFVNGALEVVTALEPRALLTALLAVEQDFGRTRELRWGPRTVDLDIALWGPRVVREADLQIPHPRLRERAFVLVPLTEIAPDAVDPETGSPVAALLAALGPTPGVELLGRPPWLDALAEGGT